MERDIAEILFEKFKKSRLGLGQFCKKFEIPLSGFTNTMRKYFSDEWDHVIELKTPKQSKYRLGRQVEYSVRDDFKKHGYVTMRSPASKSPIDILAVKKGVIVFVQCKRNMVIGVKEWNIFYDLAISVDAIPIVAGRPTGMGLLYWKMTDKKDGYKKRQPKEEITIENLAGGLDKEFMDTEERFQIFYAQYLKENPDLVGKHGRDLEDDDLSNFYHGGAKKE